MIEFSNFKSPLEFETMCALKLAARLFQVTTAPNDDLFLARVSNKIQWWKSFGAVRVKRTWNGMDTARQDFKCFVIVPMLCKTSLTSGFNHKLWGLVSIRLIMCSSLTASLIL